MALLLRSWAVLVISIKRLIAQAGLALVTMVGLVTAVSLVVSIPLYTEAVYQKTLLAEISTDETSQEVPLSLLYGYYGSWNGNKQYEEIQAVDSFFQTSLADYLDIPVSRTVRLFSTDSLELFPKDFITYSERKTPLDWIAVTMISDPEDHISLVEGKFPTKGTPEEPVEGLISLPLANDLGIQVGEIYSMRYITDAESGGKITNIFSIKIVGIWQPKDDPKAFWFSEPSNLYRSFLVTEEIFKEQISPAIYGEIYTANWYFILDGSYLTRSGVPGLINKLSNLERETANLLPKIKAMRSPVEDLRRFLQAANQLTLLLFAFAVPILGLILAFISLVSTLSVERKRNEIAVTRSRGATSLQVLGSVAAESLLLGLLSLAISIPVAIQVAKWMGHTRSFMDFSATGALNVHLTPTAIEAGVIAIIISLLISLMPALNAVRYTIVSYKQERARIKTKPFWQRLWLDVLLLIPGGYGQYMLSRQGSLVAIGSQDPLGNPLLFLVPSLLVLAITLIFLRLVPYFTSAIAWIAGRTHMVGLLLASRQLSRSPGHYNTPLLILVFTLSLSTYTASLAKTLDQHLYARTYYQIGADMKFLELGGTNAPPSLGGLTSSLDLTPEFYFFPVSEYLKVPGVQAVTRIGTYPVYVNQTGGVESGMYFGIDRVDFPKVAYWREDFASESLGTLMNALGAHPDGVLVSQNYLQEQNLRVGDSIELTITTDLGRVQVNSLIVGAFTLFPTWYQGEDGPLFVGNLDYLFDMAGGESPYKVWADMAPGLQYDQKQLELRELNLRIISWEAAPPIITEIQERPEQQGVFGFLFIGFAAAAVLTVTGFMLYALFSYQRRFIELGVLRAGGLSPFQMASYLAFELLFLILFGAAAGSALGIWISQQFIPYLQIGLKISERIPPFEVILAWDSIQQILILFGFLFIITLVLLVAFLRRMKIFQAIKLGEVV
jgi:putative ABC transport system permease protein